MNTIGMAFGEKQFQSPPPSINNGYLMQCKAKGEWQISIRKKSVFR